MNLSTNDKNGKMTARTRRAQLKFLAAYKASGVITRASVASGASRKAHYFWLDTDAQYADEFKEAIQETDDALLYEIRRRALDLEKRDTVALIVALKIRGLFVERREVSGPDGGPQEHRVLSDDDKKIAERIASRRFTVN